VFCHPILASDGYHHELIALLQNPLFSPITYELLTHFQYDSQLKTCIDEEIVGNQYPFYEKQGLLDKLKTSQNPWEKSAYESNRNGFLTVGFLYPGLKYAFKIHKRQ
jgi:hypothetical protein